MPRSRTAAPTRDTRAQVARPRAVWLLLCGLGCSAGGSYDLTVKVLVLEEAYRPQHLLWSWSAPHRGIFENKRVPSAGELPQVGTEIARLLVSVGEDRGERRIVVRGMRGEQQVSGAARRVRADGERRDVVLTLGPVVDSDEDGVPDEVDDDCPTPGCGGAAADAGAGSSTRGGTGGARPDAATPSAAGVDAAPVDGGPPGGRADAIAGGDVITGGDAITGRDAITGGDPKIANGTACATDLQCASGFCVDGVCCNTSCLGLCRACDLAGMVGLCAMIRAGDDPKNECLPENASTCGRDGTCDGQGACRKHVAGTQCLAATGCVGGTVSPAASKGARFSGIIGGQGATRLREGGLRQTAAAGA